MYSKRQILVVFCIGFVFGGMLSSFTVLPNVKFMKCFATRGRYETKNLTALPRTTNVPEAKMTTMTDTHEQVHEDKQFISLMETTIKERKETLTRACTALDNNCNGTGTSHFERAFYCKKYKLAVCDIYKSGSSTMLFTILNMNDVKWSDMDFSGWLRESGKLRFSAISNTEEKTVMWNSYTKVILVRDPFERFVSGYADKLIPTGGGHSKHYRDLSLKINQEYRHLRSDVSKRNATEPKHATFEDFLNYLLTTKETQMDGHWADYVQLCEPCAHGYDVIMKMDTLENDVRYVTSLLNLTAEHSKDFFKNQIGRSTKSNKTMEYFKTIPKELANRLYENRRRDFEMFGYRKPEWIC
uniref:carbohydrate sulfotransferase 10-like isoform X1 n=2 Tax=Ciona intestinalis TaxID=7719 RepID=UPI00089DC434|nr:carbohydrate sulfotransferase 10-like isoform X1 [Ciona intestinalis]|eukprot:XP_004226920.2 carbohydrate sulfotransferase 10-like isoform X1 [Ciona intestinalis]